MAYNRTLQHFVSPQELATLWATGRSYLLNQVVIQDNKLYRCLANHTSGTFQTDYANSNWVELSSGIVPWISAVYYVANQFVEENDRIYRCVVSHTSTTFAADIGAGKWVEVSSGSGSGTKNYIPNGDFEQNTTTGWKKFDVVLSGSKIPTGAPADGVGDGASITTFAVDSTTPIAGSYDLRVASSGVLAAGDGFISDAFTIDREDQAKPLAFSFAYEAVSGTMDFSGTSSNTFAVYIYDASGGSWIQPAGVYNLVQSSGVGIASGTFQTTATGTQYRIAVICVTATSGPVEMRFDSFQLGPQGTVQGAAISDWQNFTPTVSVASGTITNATHLGEYRRVGDSVEFRIRTTFSSTSAVFSQLRYNLPFGWVVDESKLPITLSGLSTNPVGIAYFRDNGVANYFGVVRYTSGFLVEVQSTGASGSTVSTDPVTNTAPFTFAVDDEIIVQFTVPIVGFSSNTVMSQDTDTRVVAAEVFLNSVQTGINTNNSNVKINLNTVQADTHSGFSGGSYTIPVSGWYQFNGAAQIIGANVLADRYALSIWLGTVGSGTILATGDLRTATAAVTNGYSVVCGPVYLNAGDVISLGIYGVGNNSVNTYSIQSGRNGTRLSIERLSGPATIAASETVGCLYNTLAAGTVTGAGIDLIYLTREFDTHGAYSTSTGEYTVPVSGKYTINAAYRTQTTAMSITHGTTLYVRVDGVIVKFIQNLRTQTTTGILREIMGIPVTLNLNAGQKIKFGASSDTNAAIDTASLPTAFNWVSIMRTGN